ncbi:MAG: hypothetical protein ACFCBW_17045 [Candidatus Competibacterales bacterium]
MYVNVRVSAVAANGQTHTVQESENNPPLVAQPRPSMAAAPDMGDGVAEGEELLKVLYDLDDYLEGDTPWV